MPEEDMTLQRYLMDQTQPACRKALVEGLQGELSRRPADPATRAEWARSHRTPVLRLGRVPLEAGPFAARKFGGRMAHAIGRGLKP